MKSGVNEATINFNLDQYLGILFAIQNKNHHQTFNEFLLPIESFIFTSFSVYMPLMIQVLNLMCGFFVSLKQYKVMPLLAKAAIVHLAL